MSYASIYRAGHSTLRATLYCYRAGHSTLRATLYCVVAAIGMAVPHTAPAWSISPWLRYTSHGNGYSLLLPRQWIRLAGVQWTPAGPPADLTVMTPDHQAALGITVTPTGSTTYAQADLQAITLRLLYQQNSVLTPTSIVTKHMVVNHVPYETATAYLVSGLPNMASLCSIAVTQRNHRLYAVATLIYIQLYTLSPGGSGPTATPSSGFGQSSPAHPRPVAMPTAMARAGAPPHDRPADVPVPPPPSAWRGNLCRSLADAGLAIADRNCAWRAEASITQAMATSLTIAARAPADTRPAAITGVDGFARYVDRVRGYAVAYPAQWIPVSVPGAAGAVQSPDRNVLAAAYVQSIGTPAPGPGALRSAANSAIAQVGTVITTISYQAVQRNGILYVIAFAPAVGVSTADGGIGQAKVSVVVAASQQRLYIVRAIALAIRSGQDTTPVLYPYFSPFTPFARGYQTIYDTHGGRFLTHRIPSQQ